MTAAQTMAAAPVMPKHGEVGNGRSRADDVTSTDRGNSSSYLAARLKRDHPEIAAAVERGEFKSIRAAAIKAKIVKERTPLDDLRAEIGIGRPAVEKSERILRYDRLLGHKVACGAVRATGSVLLRPRRQAVLAAPLAQLLKHAEAPERAPNVVLRVPAGERCHDRVLGVGHAVVKQRQAIGRDPLDRGVAVGGGPERGQASCRPYRG